MAISRMRRGLKQVVKEPVIALAVVVIVVAGVAAVSFGVRLATSMSGEEVSVAQARAEAVDHGSKAVVALNSLDYRKAEDGVKRWTTQSTGLLHGQIQSSQRDIVGAVQQRKTITTATVVQAALAEFDQNRARLMAVVDVRVQRQDGKQVTKRARLLGELERAGGGPWKLSALIPVPVEP